MNTIRVQGDVAELDLVGRGGEVVGTVLIDVQDIPLVSRWPHRWSLARRGPVNYAMTYTGGKQEGRSGVYMHRVLMAPPAGMVVDHINGNGLDNRRANLRVCTSAENSANHHNPHPKNTTGHRGVSFHAASGLYRASYRGDNYGYFKTPEEAAVAADAARKNPRPRLCERCRCEL